MCGRFTSTTPASALADFFEAETDLADIEPEYNVAPTTDVYVVFEDSDGQRRLDLMFWGLVPSWAESPAIGARLINARSETAASKPSFRSAFRRTRCIIPVDGFYEWVVVPERRKKQPVYICAQDSRPLAFAGLWETWHGRERGGGDEGGGTLRSCSILTGPPNQLLAPLHDRMPMILPRDDWSSWLDPKNTDLDSLQTMLVPAPEALLRWWPVSTRVNSARNHDSSLLEPVEIAPDGEAEGQSPLF